MFIFLSFKEKITEEQYDEFTALLQANNWSTKNKLGDKSYAVEIGKPNSRQIDEAERTLKNLSFVRRAERQIIFKLSPG